MHNFRVYWISLYMFRTAFPSIIRSSRRYTQHQIYVIQVSWLLASGHEMERSSISCPLALPVWHIPDAVCNVLNSGWWTERPSETCGVIFNKLENFASNWFYYRNISRCTTPWTSSLVPCHLAGDTAESHKKPSVWVAKILVQIWSSCL
jgi:hypothetical protein